ncbi:AraC family transcriptional regulator [Variovorax sp. 54]|uniref:AraC family transcriptional regulator n=1 Tax=Variovorax sp. 54 TaxID=2035212 RepID=UPI000C186C76|nr:helix-turn-helix transcriptional regulator [Variovorax sp. 54]PIF78256.1 AraC family transcriptional regulator [Variovorax sp. 54]
MDKLNLRPDEGESTPRAVAVLATDPAGDAFIPPHAHRRGQLIHAISGVMMVSAAAGSWVVPPGRGVWGPPGMTHQIRMAGEVQMRTVFVEPGTRADLGTDCRVIHVGALLRELIVAAVSLPLDYAPGGRDERVMELILDEIEAAPALSLHVPMPRHARLAALCEALIRDPAQPATLDGWAARLHMNARTLARLFERETGMTFGAWCRQARLLLSLPQLAAGASILEVALAHGYESPSAFTAMFRRTLGMPPSQYLQQEPKR